MDAESAEIRAARRRLHGLQILLHVVYALLFFEMLQYLPQAEDMAWAESRLGMIQLLIDNRVELLRIVIGGALALIYWNTATTQLSLLDRTSGRQTLLQLLQLAFVCLFVYFAISDPLLAGGPSSPALQCVSLTVAGVFGLRAWRNACATGLIDSDLTKPECDAVATRTRIAPLTALLNTPFAFVGPIAWTLGWLVIPLALTGIAKLPGAIARLRSRLAEE